jgi:TadE-like protein
MGRLEQLNRRRRHRSGGQAMVEFALVIPIFLVLLIAIAEFSFLFTSYLSVGFASHDGVQMAATYGNTAGADAAVLQRIINDVGAPANSAQLKTVDIYWVNTSTADASPVGGAETIYTYDGGAHTYTLPSGGTVVLPFVQSSNGYPESSRCNVNAGIGCVPGHTTVDTIGVKITYQYTWVTPFPQMINGPGTGPLLTQNNIMRLEPVL